MTKKKEPKEGVWLGLLKFKAMMKQIHRNDNDEADFLARQAILYNLDISLAIQAECASQVHGDHCPVLQALNYVSLPSVTLITTSCC